MRRRSTKRGEVVVGEHPNAMVLSKDGARLFVACANTNAVWVIDVASKTAKEQISVALFPNAPPGATPNALALSPDGRTLLVANADNNTVAVVDVARPGAQRRDRVHPDGLVSDRRAFSRDGSRLFILSGKGLTVAEQSARHPTRRPGRAEQYTGAMLLGSLSMVRRPTPRRSRR